MSASIPTLDCGSGHFLALDLPNGAAHFVCPTLGVLTEIDAAHFPRIAGAWCRCGHAMSAPMPAKAISLNATPYAT